jgi:hypothetical protein
VCAYAYLPLLDDEGRVLTDEPKRMPVSSAVVASYRSSAVEESMQVLPQPLLRAHTHNITAH